MVDVRDNAVPTADPLIGTTLIDHVSALAYNVGPRPAGHEPENRARSYIRKTLTAMGIEEIKAQPFPATDTWAYALGSPLALSLGGLLISRLGWPGRFLGSILGGAAAYLTWRAASGMRQPLVQYAPQKTSANLIVRIPSAGRPKHKVVLLAHTDTNRHRDSFSDARKGMLPQIVTGIMGLQAAGAVAQIIGNPWLTRAIGVAQMASLGAVWADERGPYVDGANDNASAVACLLGLAQTLNATPLQHTDVWIVFTGAEESGLGGVHTLLDEYGDQLMGAYFVDLEMVGYGQLAYIAEYSGFSTLSTYTPDTESVALVERTAIANPSFRVNGKKMMFLDEIAAVRRRGYNGVTLVTLGPGEWPANWHRDTDAIGNIQPEALERTARFTMAMLKTLDAD